MRFQPGVVTLSGVENGVLGAGIVPLARMLRDESYADNVAQVVIGAATTTVVVSPVMTVAVGDRIFVYGNLYGVKGAGQGLTEIFVQTDSGTAVGMFADSLGAPISEMINGVAHDWATIAWGIFRVTTAGTIIFKLAGRSAIADFTVPAAQGEIHVLALIGTG